jgi:hypothetical protein
MAHVDAGTDAAPPPRRPLRRVLAVLLVLGVLVALAVAALPYGIAWGIRSALLKAGADAVEVGDVEANPFTLRLAVSGLTVVHRGEQVLRVGRAEARGDWHALLDRHVLLTSVAIDEARVRLVRRADGSFAGALPGPGGGGGSAKGGGSRWGFGVAALDVTKSELRYEAPDQGHALQITRLGLRNLATWTPDAPTAVTLDGALDGGVLQVNGSVLPLAGHPSAKARVRLTGLPLSNLQALAPVLKDLSGNLSLDQQTAVAVQPDGLRIAQRGTVEATDVAWPIRGRQVAAGRLTWDGDIGLAFPPGGPPAWALDGHLAGENLSGRQTATGRHARLAGLSIEGRLDGGSGGVTASGRARATGFALVRGTPEAGIARLEEAGIEGITLTAPGAVEVTRAALKGLVLTPPAPADAQAPPLLALGAVDLDGIHVTRASVDVNDLRLSAPDALLVRDPDGRFSDLAALIDALGPPAPPPKPRPEPGEEAAPPPGPHEEAPPAVPVVFRLGKASLALGGRVRVRDLSVQPPYEATVDLEKASLKGLDTAHPHAPSEVVLAGTVDRFTQVALGGTLAPLAKRASMDLSGSVTRLDLPSVDPYAAPALGYHLDSGQLDAKLRLGADAGRLDGDADVDVRGLTVSPVKDAKGGLSDELSMPLDAALDLMKDRHGTIRVKVPVSGNLDDPRVGIRDIVNKAVAKSITAGAITYAKVVLQPFGASLEAGQRAGTACALRLDPMPFAPGSAKLTENDRAYAAKVGRLLSDRPKVTLRLCGRATPKDRDATAPAAGTPGGTAPAPPKDPDAALRVLAEARADAVKDVLVRVHGVDPGRLLVCRPEVDADPAADPRVDMLI